MKKKTDPKAALVLGRETLRPLGSETLEAVNGGAWWTIVTTVDIKVKSCAKGDCC